MRKRWFKKWLICIWKHKENRCYPEVWNRGLDGPWHCDRCLPCDEMDFGSIRSK